VIADAARGFDRIRPGYHGSLYAEISPRTFPVLVREGSRLSQIRFRHGHAVLAGAALAALHEQERLVDTAAPDLSDGVPVGVDLRGVDQAGVALGAIADETVSPKTSLRTSEMGLVS
jgi:dCTP deaminase